MRRYKKKSLNSLICFFSVLLNDAWIQIFLGGVRGGGGGGEEKLQLYFPL